MSATRCGDSANGEKGSRWGKCVHQFNSKDAMNTSNLMYAFHNFRDSPGRSRGLTLNVYTDGIVFSECVFWMRRISRFSKPFVGSDSIAVLERSLQTRGGHKIAGHKTKCG